MINIVNKIVEWALALVVSMPIVSSCENKADKQIDLQLAVKVNPMEAVKGSQFLTVQASGDWTITATDAESGTVIDWLTIEPSTGTGSTSSVILTASANTGDSSRKAELRLTASRNSTTLMLEQKGSSDTPSPNPDPDPDPTPTPTPSPAAGWLELPGIPADTDCDFFTHSMKLGGVQTRNYSFLWDYDNLVAQWVAYPLSKWNIGSGSRTNAWALDPLLPADKQPVLYKGFAAGNAGWHARGHQIPSADRLASGCNSMTFYGTNMTPQRQDKFNGTIWANLESKVRSWANSSDTCYVVTGCVTKGSTTYCLDNYNKKVTIPTAYYKAVLRYSRNTTLGRLGYMACAIWMDHKDYDDASVTSSYAMSIDELEAKLGIDFFVNLPGVIGEEAAAEVEAQDPKKVSWWW